jgi:asparagine synthase (glutamine-hydrolysing)
MCGIASIINLEFGNQLDNVSERIAGMVEVMRYRGPDAKGTFIDKTLGALGHARLSIIATSAESDQPFHATHGRTCIVFNGEIYNYIELKKELETQFGVQFRTKSDTEVLLAAYDVWGDECVSRFNGMWAFVIFDFAKKRVFCSRDRFGVKPFLYAVDSKHVYVGSEAKAILHAKPAFRKPNFRALSLLLRASVGGENLETCFEGVLRLAPGHNLIVENGKIQIKRYWDYPNPDEVNASAFSYDEGAEKLLGLLQDAIRLRLRSDVPVGFTLSGGIDSSAIVMLAGSMNSDRFKAYTATYEHPNYRSDESKTATAIAKKAGLEHIPVLLTAEDLLPIMSKMVHHLESPHAAMPIIPYWKIMERASKDIKVVLEGQGADELLGGYASTIAFPAFIDGLLQGRFHDCFGVMKHGLKGSYGSPAINFFAMMIRSMLPVLHRSFRILRGDESVYQNELAQDNCDRPAHNNWKNLDRVNATLRRQHENGLVNLLQYGDAIPMAHSIEGRLPFMDYRIVEFVMKLPGHYKFRNAFSKSILRKSLDGILPNEMLASREKRGFDSPVGVWFAESLEKTIKPILFSQACKQRGIFDTNRIDKLLEKHRSGSRELTSQIFRWTATELWFQEFID